MSDSTSTKPESADDYMGGFGCLGSIVGALIAGCVFGIIATLHVGFFSGLLIALLAAILGMLAGGFGGIAFGARVYRTEKKRLEAKSARSGN